MNENIRIAASERHEYAGVQARRLRRMKLEAEHPYLALVQDCVGAAVAAVFAIALFAAFAA